MSKSKAGALAVMISALFLAAQPALAQDKKADKGPIRAQKILVNNDRVRVTESVFKPGEENPMVQRGYRITRVLKGSTSVLKTYSNGKTEKLEWKEGGVYVTAADNASAKNVGKSEVTIYTVVLKPEDK